MKYRVLIAVLFLFCSGNVFAQHDGGASNGGGDIIQPWTPADFLYQCKARLFAAKGIYKPEDRKAYHYYSFQNFSLDTALIRKNWGYVAIDEKKWKHFRARPSAPTRESPEEKLEPISGKPFYNLKGHAIGLYFNESSDKKSVTVEMRATLIHELRVSGIGSSAVADFSSQHLGTSVNGEYPYGLEKAPGGLSFSVNCIRVR